MHVLYVHKKRQKTKGHPRFVVFRRKSPESFEVGGDRGAWRLFGLAANGRLVQIGGAGGAGDAFRKEG